MHQPHGLVHELGQAAEAVFPESSGQECVHPRAGSACDKCGEVWEGSQRRYCMWVEFRGSSREQPSPSLFAPAPHLPSA